MPKSNKVIADNHFRKDWQRRVKTWFNQPARHERRRKNRAQKAVRVFPRPVAGSLRPLVHAPTPKYNMKVRLGRGFTLEELKEAGVNPTFAKTIGIAVDYRRRNKSDKSLKTNVQRLKEYKSKLVLFPRNNKKVKTGETRADQVKVAQLHGEVLPVAQTGSKLEVVSLSSIDNKKSAYTELRIARANARLVGVREKRAKEKAEQEANKKQ
eukprot:TRINITY_DN1469_c0_g1_i1.p1 TRINITY_DN1469_c0_g1~~TRINITY_DN1469_c0_g1_i1.p1  ORF type:complete len:210 (+),score=92.36 TRINITY_DN1469_c0_g1_i1:49-678(+)